MTKIEIKGSASNQNLVDAVEMLNAIITELRNMVSERAQTIAKDLEAIRDLIDATQTLEYELDGTLKLIEEE